MEQFKLDSIKILAIINYKKLTLTLEKINKVKIILQSKLNFSTTVTNINKMNASYLS